MRLLRGEDNPCRRWGSRRRGRRTGGSVSGCRAPDAAPGVTRRDLHPSGVWRAAGLPRVAPRPLQSRRTSDTRPCRRRGPIGAGTSAGCSKPRRFMATEKPGRSCGRGCAPGAPVDAANTTSKPRRARATRMPKATITTAHSPGHGGGRDHCATACIGSPPSAGTASAPIRQAVRGHPWPVGCGCVTTTGRTTWPTIFNRSFFGIESSPCGSREGNANPHAEGESVVGAELRDDRGAPPGLGSSSGRQRAVDAREVPTEARPRCDPRAGRGGNKRIPSNHCPRTLRQRRRQDHPRQSLAMSARGRYGAPA